MHPESRRGNLSAFFVSFDLMGINCNIIITYDSDTDENVRLSINQYLNIPPGVETQIVPVGNRAWDPTDLQTIVVCMKSWHEEECQQFFTFLRTLPFKNRKSVQIYYAEAASRVVPFTSFNLFQNITLSDNGMQPETLPAR